MKNNLLNLAYFVVLCLCLTPFFSPAIALIIGLCFAAAGIKNPKISSFKSLALQASIVLMGFGMNLDQVINASKTGFAITAGSVFFTMAAGLILGKIFKVEKNTAILISSGTAICGGSAIAAVGPVLDAEDNQISFSLVVVFFLNAIALFIFPMIGHYLNLSQEVFGYWAAIAIHDTSSVVGAGASYGVKALELATIIKLTRALWIIPLSLAISFFVKEKGNGKIKPPWFIGLFVLAIVFAHFLPQFEISYKWLSWFGKKGMVAALFLIGSNMSISSAKEAGVKSFALGITLWIIVASLALVFFMFP